MKRSTLNFQRGDRKGAWWPGYGDRHDFGAQFDLRRVGAMAFRAKKMGTDTILVLRKCRPDSRAGKRMHSLNAIQS